METIVEGEKSRTVHTMERTCIFTREMYLYVNIFLKYLHKQIFTVILSDCAWHA